MRFLFVRPAFCHGLPSHGRLTTPQLPFGSTFPLQGGQQTHFVVSDVHCLASAPCRAHRKKGPLGEERAFGKIGKSYFEGVTPGTVIAGTVTGEEGAVEGDGLAEAAGVPAGRFWLISAMTSSVMSYPESL